MNNVALVLSVLALAVSIAQSIYLFMHRKD